MPLLAPPGPTALPYLRTTLGSPTVSFLGSGVVFRQNFLPPFAALALRLGEFSLPHNPFFASIFAYLTPSNDLESSPSLAVQVELRPYDQEPGNTLGVPVVHIDVGVDGGAVQVQGDLVSPEAILTALRCENWGEVSAFVQCWVLMAAEKKWYGFEDHIVPITEELEENLRRLCGRQAFCENVRNAVDGNLAADVEVREYGSFELVNGGVKVDGNGAFDDKAKEDGSLTPGDEAKVDGNLEVVNVGASNAAGEVDDDDKLMEE